MRIQKPKSKKLLIAIPAVVVLLALGYFGYAYASQSLWPFAAEETTQDDSNINYDPPTEQEEAASQDGKKNGAGQETEVTEEDLQNISVGIAYAGFDDQEGVVDIRAFTPDVIESDGTCTATLTLNGQTVTASSKAFIDSTSSQCEPILIPLSEFPVSGQWQLIVDYASAKSKGTSATMTVEVTK